MTNYLTCCSVAIIAIAITYFAVEVFDGDTHCYAWDDDCMPETQLETIQTIVFFCFFIVPQVLLQMLYLVFTVLADYVVSYVV